MFDLILCKILVDGSHPFAPLWLWVCARYPRRCSILLGNYCLSSALKMTTEGLLEMLVQLQMCELNKINTKCKNFIALLQDAEAEKCTPLKKNHDFEEGSKT